MHNDYALLDDNDPTGRSPPFCYQSSRVPVVLSQHPSES